MSAIQERLELSTVTPLHWLAVVLALLSAIIHVLFFVNELGLGFLGVSFVLAAGGFVGAVVLFLIGYRRRLLYLVGIPYTVSQIAIWGWYVVSDKFGVDVYAMIDKPAQILLIAILITLYFRES